MSKPLGEYHKDSSDYKVHCKSCFNSHKREREAALRTPERLAARREKSRKWRESHVDHSRYYKHYNLKRFGLTLDNYTEMWLVQGGSCAVCGGEETAVLSGVVKSLAVDHSHTNTNVRGLLCQRCNTALGSLNDSADLLGKAARYLAVTSPD